MWNYEPGVMRCANEHVFAITDLGPKESKVVRLDRPSPRERLQDFALGTFFGALTLALAQILVNSV